MTSSPRAVGGMQRIFSVTRPAGVCRRRAPRRGSSGRRVFITGVTCLLLFLFACASGGRVLHVDNPETVPYTIQDMKLKRRIVRVLVRRRLLTGAQQYSCQLNIMEIGRYYVLEVWPEGTKSTVVFSVKLRKPFLRPVEKFSGTR